MLSVYNICKQFGFKPGWTKCGSALTGFNLFLTSDCIPEIFLENFTVEENQQTTKKSHQIPIMTVANNKLVKSFFIA